jgi:hypothetical protein
MYVAKTPIDRGIGLNQLICNGELMIEARTPNVRDKHDLVHAFEHHKVITTLAGENHLRALNERKDLRSDEPVHYIGRHGGAWGTQTVIGRFNDRGVMDVEAKTSEGHLSWWTGKGEGYAVGAPGYLDHAREWYLNRDTGMLYFIPPPGIDPATSDVYLKDREYAIDLLDKKHIIVDGVDTLIGSVRMENTEHCTILNGVLLYGGQHSFFDNPYVYEGGGPAKCGIFVTGNNNRIERCRLAFNAGASIVLGGENNRVLNSRIHDSGLLGSYYAGIYVFQDKEDQGGGHIIASNTIYFTGRGAINISSIGVWGDPGVFARPMQIHHNELSGTMLICDDGGAIYQFATDGGGSEIHHNWILPSRGESIYFDNHSHGWQVHHNVILGDVNVNHPNDRIHVFNNTVLETRYKIPKYFWSKDNYIANNIDAFYVGTNWEWVFPVGVRSTFVRFHADGGKGLNYRVKDMVEENFTREPAREATVRGHELPAYRTDYYGAYAYGPSFTQTDDPWVPGCGWGGEVPAVPVRATAPLAVPASELTQSDNLLNNALFIETTAPRAWAIYPELDMSVGYTHIFFEVMMEEPMSNAVIEVRLGGPDGDVLARADIAYRPEDNHQFFLDTATLAPVEGVQDICLVLQADQKLRLSTFTLAGAGDTPLYPIHPVELVHPDGNKKVEESSFVEGSRVLLMSDGYRSPDIYLSGSYELMGCTRGSWVFFPKVDFGSQPQALKVNAGSNHKYDDPAPRIELRSGALDGPVLAEVDLQKIPQGTWQERAMEVHGATGVHDVFVVFPRPFHGGVNYIVMIP